MGREIERDHLALSSHGWIIHNSVVLATITSSSVKKHDFLRALATKLIEYLGLSPYRSIDIDIFASDMIFIDETLLIALKYRVRLILVYNLLGQVRLKVRVGLGATIVEIFDIELEFHTFLDKGVSFTSTEMKMLKWSWIGVHKARKGANRFSSLANSAPTHASPGFSTLRHPFRYSRDVLVGCVVLLPRRF